MSCLNDFNLDYLNLALPRIEKKIVKAEKFTRKCYSEIPFKHNQHGENMQLNSIVDLIISLGTHLEEHGKHNMSRNESSSDVMHNLDYIKNQNNNVLKILGTTKSNSSSINLKDLDKKYTKIKQLLEEIKQLIVT